MKTLAPRPPASPPRARRRPRRGSRSRRPTSRRRRSSTPDGTLYEVAHGHGRRSSASTDVGLDPDDYVIEWSSRAQDGTQQPAASCRARRNSNPKTSLDLTVDEPTGSLVRAVARRGSDPRTRSDRSRSRATGDWTLADLLPNIGFPHAYNPQMLLSHQTVHSIDDNGQDVSTNRSILSVIWWEEARYAQARYAPDLPRRRRSTPAAVKVYDLPTSSAAAGRHVASGTFRAAAYMYPALQLEGPGGAVLASFRGPRPRQAVRRPHHVPDRPRPARRPTTRPGCAGGSRSSASRWPGRSRSADERARARIETASVGTIVGIELPSDARTGATARRCATSASTAGVVRPVGPRALRDHDLRRRPAARRGDGGAN